MISVFLDVVTAPPESSTMSSRGIASLQPSTNRLVLETLEDRCVPATLTVTTGVDEVVNDDVLSLSEAIELINAGGNDTALAQKNANLSLQNQVINQTNAFGVNDTVIFDDGSLVANVSTVTSNVDMSTLTASVLIDGSGTSGGNNDVTIDGNDTHSLFSIDASTGDITVTFESLTITGGRADATTSRFQGGGINVFNGDTNDNVNILRATISENFAQSGGGGISVSGANLKIAYSSIDDSLGKNHSTFDGGGVMSQNSDVSISHSSISGNSSTGARGGGGIVFRGVSSTLYITDSVISRNTAYEGFGGGIALLSGSFTIKNSEISFNKAVEFNAQGGGIHAQVDSPSLLENVRIIGNSAPIGGGVSIFDGMVTIRGSLIDDNHATQAIAGGILTFDLSSLSLLIEETVISNNTAVSDGGGINNRFGGDVKIVNSLITGNQSGGDGGGIRNGETTSIYNSTISGNFAESDGGGIYNTTDGELTIVNSTITDNEAGTDGTGEGGGIYNRYTTTSLYLDNTIVINNTDDGTAPDILGGAAITSNGFNIIGNNTNSNITGPGTDIVNVNVNQVIDTTLVDNGGPTQTHALVANSLALDAGNDADAATLTTDQRGVDRFFGNSVDIGAFEDTQGELFTAPDANTLQQTPFTVTLRALDLLAGTDLNTAEKSLIISNGTVSNFIDNGNGTTSLTLTPSNNGDVLIEAYGDRLLVQALGFGNELTSNVESTTFEAFYFTIDTAGLAVPTLEDFSVTGGLARQIVDNNDGTYTLIFSPNTIGIVTVSSVFGDGEVSTLFNSLSFGVSNDDFVRNLYTVIYARTPSEEEIAFWVTEMADGATRKDVLAGFLSSDEFSNMFASNAAFIDGLYQQLFARDADTDYWTNLLNNGASLHDVVFGILSSQEYYDRLVRETYNEFLLRPIDPMGLAYWIDELLVNNLNSDQLRTQIANSDEAF